MELYCFLCHPPCRLPIEQGKVAVCPRGRVFEEFQAPPDDDELCRVELCSDAPDEARASCVKTSPIRT